MKKKGLLLIIAIIVISCSSGTETINGDLYFKRIDFVNYYDANDSEKENIKNLIKSIRQNNSKTIEEEKLIKHFDILESLNLLESPYIRIKTDKEVKLVFMNKENFEKVKDFKLQNLLENNKKVNLKLEVERKDSGVFLCKKIVEIQEISGKTLWEK